MASVILPSLNSDLDERSSNVLVNLASVEYFGAVQPERIEARIISPMFLDEVNGRFKIVSFHAKRARGAMASWLILNRVKSVRAIKDFDGLGYHFDPERSEPDRPAFVRFKADVK
jgi:cytoplasmic iron level regulating protein YaaA (DUF328/UPF0246 family)